MRFAMSNQRAIEIMLPEGSQPSDSDIALLKAACESVATICLDSRREWFERLRQLESEEWRVNWALQWAVEATKGRCSESVTAPTIDQAFHQLSDLARLHTIEGCP
jgi:hypothetical protein